MSTVLSSMSEITRVGGWALRGLGYPFGTAERGVGLLAWTEAVGGQGIRGLRVSEPAIAKSLSAKAAVRKGNSASRWTVQANGRHLIELGAAAIDLATHGARQESIVQVCVDGVFGFEFLASLANLLVRRKLAGLLTYNAADTDLLPEGWARRGWLFANNVAEGAFFAHGDLDSVSGELLREAVSGSHTLEVSSVGPFGSMVALALSPGHLLIYSLTDVAHSASKDIRIVDYGQRVTDALRNGVAMDADELKYLYELEMRTWAPTSERSRSQAGYGIY